MLTGNGIEPLFRFLGIQTPDHQSREIGTKKILWLADEAGEFVVDLAIIQCLTKLGHKIIIAFKGGPLFTKVDFKDAREDEVLSRELDGALFLQEKNMSKNELVKTLRSDYDIIAMSDGTRENLNLLLTSTTFARIFKEVDGIISRGHDQRRRFFVTHFQFTQDIFNISPGEQGAVSILYRPKHPAVIKFSHKDLENKARKIIDRMVTAKKQGMTVVFYSGIIGPSKEKFMRRSEYGVGKMYDKRLGEILPFK